MQRALLLLAASLTLAAAQPFLPGQNVVPVGTKNILIMLKATFCPNACVPLVARVALCLVVHTTVSLTGNLRTTDNGGPYNLTLLNVQEFEIKGKHIRMCSY